MKAVLALNAGSSSIRFTLFSVAPGNGALSEIRRGSIDELGNRPKLIIIGGHGETTTIREFPTDTTHEQGVEAILQQISDPQPDIHLFAVGHRVVHGGVAFAEPVLIDSSVLASLEGLVPLAPLHQPHNIGAIRSVSVFMPNVPQVACFDTAFHRTQPNVAMAFALPRALSEEGIQRFGFHGLSYEYIADTLPDHAGELADGRVVVAHLGHGASMCAMRNRRSIATTMGFTALDGLPMGRRCGALDPGVILYLMREKGMDYDALVNLLYHRSGLLGVSGVSDDMRELQASAQPEAHEAIDLFVYRIVRELGSLASALGGLDALVFTGGIGENAAPIRAQVCRQAAWLGVHLDENANHAGKIRISPNGSEVEVFVIPTNEDLMIARHTIGTLEHPSPKTQVSAPVM